MQTLFDRSIWRAAALALPLLLTAPVRADDSEIYLGDTQTGHAYVMLTLDMRSNLFSDVGCVYGDELNDGNTYCKTVWAAQPDIYDYMVKNNDEYGLGFQQGSALTIFDAMRAIFAALFQSAEFNDKYIGLMISHNGNAPGNATYNSDGAYVLAGFKLFDSSDSNHAKRELLRKLYSIPQP